MAAAFLPAQNCTTRRAVPGPPRAASPPHATFTAMKKQQNNSIQGWTLQIAFSIALLSVSAVLLESSFKATPAASGFSAPINPVAAPANTNTPVLVVTTESNQFSKYYSDILKAEGLNAFQTADIGTVNAAALANYDTVLLGEVSLTPAQVRHLLIGLMPAVI